MDVKLAEKIYKVMCESESLKKDMNVAGQYDAISESAVLNAIKPLLKDHKLILIPVEAEITQHNKLSQVTAKYKIIDVETGEFEVLATVGNGADTQDKGSGKAWTYAYKALIQKTFCLFSGEDTDNTHSDDIDKQIKQDEAKVTTAMLQDALNNQSQVTLEQIFATYKKDTNKDCDDLQFIKQEYKQKYYKMLGGK